MPQIPSTRWCPTPEQLMILEEMYRNGIRTPNASQIQQITAHLSLYGKIEDKNVFYWFQNHKARERQKLRQRLGRQHQVLHQSAEGSSTHPTPPLLRQAPPNFLYQEAHITSQGMGLVGKLEATAGDQISQEEQEAALTAASEAEYGQAWMMATMMEDGLPHDQYYCRPSLKTLDLFPTKTTGRGSIKDECSNSNSKSSGSTSTN